MKKPKAQGMIKKVMCADDDEITLMLLSTILKKAQFTEEVVAVTDGRQAIDMLNSPAHADIDLLFLDLNMPVKSGWDVLDEMTRTGQKQWPLVFVLTSSVSPEDELRSKQYTMVQGYIRKPLTVEKVAGLKDHPVLRPRFTN